jgi:hypothetical protein
MQTRHEFLENFSSTMEKERMMLHYSQSEMARALDMSLSSYKRIVNGENHKIDLYTGYCMHQLTGKLMDELCHNTSPLSTCFPLLRQLSDRQLRFVHSVLEFEINFSRSLQNGQVPEDFATLLIPTGDMYDGMIYDSTALDKINIAAYRPRYGSLIDCAVRITSSHLSPVYQQNDVLLISCSPIRDGDTGIFVDNTNGRVYIRRLRQTEPNRLEPLTNFGQTIYLDNSSRADAERWLKFGVVLTKLRT